MEIIIFSKVLTESDMSKLVVPSRALRHFPIPEGQNVADLTVEDSQKVEWKFRFYTRPNGKYAKPLFTKGWCDYARDKGLQVGDEIVFFAMQRHESGTLHYKIEVKKNSFKLFGQKIRTNSEALELKNTSKENKCEPVIQKEVHQMLSLQSTTVHTDESSSSSHIPSSKSSLLNLSLQSKLTIDDSSNGASSDRSSLTSSLIRLPPLIGLSPAN